MVAALAPQTTAIERDFSIPAQLSQWRKVCQVNTVEEAERLIESLKSSGVTASLSMIDGLCVIARRNPC